MDLGVRELLPSDINTVAGCHDNGRRRANSDASGVLVRHLPSMWWVATTILVSFVY